MCVAGRRVNVLLALLPSALHIAPAARLREFASSILRPEAFSKREGQKKLRGANLTLPKFLPTDYRDTIKPNSGVDIGS